MFGILAMASMPFAATVIEDPITQNSYSVFGTTNDDGSFALICEPGSGSISISVTPAFYDAPPTVNLFWRPTTASRFARQGEAEKDAWRFERGMITYSPKPVFSQVKKTARFLDMLSRDTEFSIRYSGYPDEVETITFRYTIDVPSLQSFIGACGPKRVIRHLREMNSPAAPQE